GRNINAGWTGLNTRCVETEEATCGLNQRFLRRVGWGDVGHVGRRHFRSQLRADRHKGTKSPGRKAVPPKADSDLSVLADEQNGSGNRRETTGEPSSRSDSCVSHASCRLSLPRTMNIMPRLVWRSMSYSLNPKRTVAELKELRSFT